MGVREGHEWEPFEGLAHDEARIARVPRAGAVQRAKAAGAFTARGSKSPKACPFRPRRKCRRRKASGASSSISAARQTDFAKRIVTTSPDVTVSTNLGGWVNRRGVFDRAVMEDRFKEQKIASTYRWSLSPQGQHIELGIAENNLFTLLAALGLSHSLFGERLLPIGTLYDPFIARGLDALNYACYQDARFHSGGDAVGRDAGAGRRRASIDRHAVDRHGAGRPCVVRARLRRRTCDHAALVVRLHPARRQERHGTSWLRDETGGSVYLRLSTRPLEQPKRKIEATLARDIIDGGYWLRPPGPNCEIVIAYQGVWRRKRSQQRDFSPKTAAMSPCSPSPPPTGSMRAGKPRRARACGAWRTRHRMSNACFGASRLRRASSP